MKATIPALSKSLHDWYVANHRPLPWRANKDPYRIWISEIMLQQTTVTAVIPFYENFLKKFPTVSALAKADLKDVLESWAGLGYYSRARNLHKAAQVFARTGFPKTTNELLSYPGLGPYTARAIASIAFQEPVGVLDGNVIRVLSRLLGFRKEWWKSGPRQELQRMADDLAQTQPADIISQGLMELGATVCTPTTPVCMLCPWQKHCVSFEKNLTQKLPLKKPRKESEIWHWSATLIKKENRWALIKNESTLPFLKGQWIFPGSAKKLKTKPKNFHLKHNITHHDIYISVSVTEKNKTPRQSKDLQWVRTEDLKRINPSSLLQKILQRTTT